MKKTKVQKYVIMIVMLLTLLSMFAGTIMQFMR